MALPLVIPPKPYIGKTITEMRALSLIGKLGLLGNLILAKVEGDQLLRGDEEAVVTEVQQKECEGTRNAIIKFLTDPKLSWTISKLKASLEVEDLSCSAPLGAIVTTGVKTVNSKVLVPALGVTSFTTKGVGVGQGTGTVNEALMMKKNGGKHGGRMTATGHAYIGLSNPVPNSDTIDPANDFTAVNLYFQKIKKELL